MLFALTALVALAGCSETPRARTDGGGGLADLRALGDALADGALADRAATDGAGASADATRRDGPPSDGGRADASRRDARPPDSGGSTVPAVVVYGEPSNLRAPVCSSRAAPDAKPCQTHDLAWLRTIYGIRVVPASEAAARAAGAVYRLVQVIEREGPVAIESWLVDAQGKRLAGREVTYCYPAQVPATGDPGCGTNLVPTQSSSDGHADFIMTGSAYVGCGQPGPFAAWVNESGIPSDRVFGIGMLLGTNHRHVNFVFQRVSIGKAAAAVVGCPFSPLP